MSTNHNTSASDPCLFTLDLIDNSLKGACQFSYKHLVFYFRLKSYEPFERTKFAGNTPTKLCTLLATNILRSSYKVSYEV